MYNDIVALRRYYSSTAGKLAERVLAVAIAGVYRPSGNERVLGFGYVTPWLDRIAAHVERTIAFMPASQGAFPWPLRQPSRTALVFEEDLPLPDSAVDAVLMVHALEHAQAPRETLAEFWRVLAPNGRLVVVVPNRRGLWARFEHTPFGTGRPFSQGQIEALLREAGFTVEQVGQGLHYPPLKRVSLLRLCVPLERIGRRLWPLFAGVLVVEARKRVFQGLPVAAKRSRRVFAPVLAPQGAARNASNKDALST